MSLGFSRIFSSANLSGEFLISKGEKMRTSASAVSILAVLFLASSAFASGSVKTGESAETKEKAVEEHAAPVEKTEPSATVGHENAYEAHDLAPASRYDGGTPIDLNHGRVGNNGTIGKANPVWEALGSSELTAPGLIAAPYPYSAKKSFVNAIQDRLRFFEEAVENLEEKSNINNKPEVAQFSERALPEIKNRLDQAKKALKTANGAGEKDWRNAEDGARAAFVNLKTTYEGMMKTQQQQTN
jgi:hypothetical protein